MHCKPAVALSCLGHCGAAEGIMLQSSYYFGSSQWCTFDFVVGRFGVQYTLFVISLGCFNVYRVWYTVKAVDCV